LVEASVQIGGRCSLNGHGSARLAVSASRFASDIVCMANGRSVNAKDVMSVSRNLFDGPMQERGPHWSIGPASEPSSYAHETKEESE
jgi:hypothetical protein